MEKQLYVIRSTNQDGVVRYYCDCRLDQYWGSNISGAKFFKSIDDAKQVLKGKDFVEGVEGFTYVNGVRQKTGKIYPPRLVRDAIKANEGTVVTEICEIKLDTKYTETFIGNVVEV